MAEVELLGEFSVARGLMAGNPLQLPPGALVDGRNVTYSRGRLCKRRGYVMLKANGVGAKVVRLAHHFRTSGGSARLVAVTSSDLYSWVASTSSFADKGNLSGGDLTNVDACDWGTGYVYVCKQGQALVKWDGGGGDFVPSGAVNPIGGGAYYPSYIRPYAGCLVGANDSTNQQTVCWSDALFPDTFTGTSFNTLVDARGEITGLELVGTALAIFARESIHTMLYVGGTPPYLFHRAEPSIGTLAPRSVCLLGPPYSGQLVFLGSDLNIHSFDGLRAVPQGDTIHEILKDALEENYLGKASGMVWPNEGVYWLAVPASGSTENNLLIEWRYRLGQWYLHELSGANKAWSAIARFPKSAAPTWNDIDTAGTIWTNEDRTWLEIMQETGLRPVGFLGTSGDFVEFFKGLLDGTGPIEAWANFAPFETANHETKESAYLEILDDRSTSKNLEVRLGSSVDAASFAYETRQHLLAPTTDPSLARENFRKRGKWFQVRVQNLAASEQFNLRGWRLWGMPVGKDR